MPWRSFHSKGYCCCEENTICCTPKHLYSQLLFILHTLSGTKSLSNHWTQTTLYLRLWKKQGTNNHESHCNLRPSKVIAQTYSECSKPILLFSWNHAHISLSWNTKHRFMSLCGSWWGCSTSRALSLVQREGDFNDYATEKRQYVSLPLTGLEPYDQEITSLTLYHLNLARPL